MALRNVEVKKISMKPDINKVHVVLRQDQIKQDLIKQEPTKPEPIKPEPTKPEPTKPEPIKPEVLSKQELIMKQELELKRDEMLRQEIALEQSKIDENHDESSEHAQDEDEVSDPGDLISVSAREIHNLVEQMKSDKQIYIEKLTKLHKKIVMKDKIIENNMTLIDLLQKEIERLKTKK